MDRNQKEVRRQEDAALNRGLLWVGAAIVLELLLMFVKRYYIEYRIDSASVALAETLSYVLYALRVAGCLGAAVCVLWAVLRLRMGKGTAVPVVIAVVLGALAVCAHVSIAFKATGVQMLFLLVAAWAGLALVYYLYQKEFFLAATASGFACVGLWFIRYGGGELELVICEVGLLIVLLAAMWLRRHDGGKFVDPEASYTAIFLSGLIGAIALILASFLGATAAYYLLFLMVAWLFALLVYYTVKMM
jgi:hypothetical protein